jgi:hypothetical protein
MPHAETKWQQVSVNTDPGIRVLELLEQLNDYQLLNKISAPDQPTEDKGQNKTV